MVTNLLNSIEASNARHEADILSVPSSLCSQRQFSFLKWSLIKFYASAARKKIITSFPNVDLNSRPHDYVCESLDWGGQVQLAPGPLLDVNFEADKPVTTNFVTTLNLKVNVSKY